MRELDFYFHYICCCLSWYSLIWILQFSNNLVWTHLDIENRYFSSTKYSVRLRKAFFSPSYSNRKVQKQSFIQTSSKPHLVRSLNLGLFIFQKLVNMFKIDSDSPGISSIVSYSVFINVKAFKKYIRKTDKNGSSKKIYTINFKLPWKKIPK